MSEYYIAQICENGHVISSTLKNSSEQDQKFCHICGASTLIKCPQCQSPIRGKLFDMYGMLADYEAPNYCLNCGHAFPWTENRLKAAHEFVQMQDKFSDEERQFFDKSIDDLVKDTPSTTVSASKIKMLLNKAGPPMAAMFREIIIDVVSETAKRILFPTN